MTTTEKELWSQARVTAKQALVPEEPKWKVPGSPDDFSFQEILDRIRKTDWDPTAEYDVGIGTDSHLSMKTFHFVTVICIHKRGKGGMYYYLQTETPKSQFPLGAQKMRMFDEVSKSITLALEIHSKTGVKPDVHIDASPPELAEFTSKFSKELDGYVQGCGFRAILKPGSYVAHAIADRHARVRRSKRARRVAAREERRKTKKTRNP